MLQLNAQAAPLFTGAHWDNDMDLIQRIHDECEVVALKEFGLTCYPNQIEVISSEQMLDAYASIGLPLMYKHWSFGKHYAQHETGYRKGLRGLAYEIVINSDPCISYIMEDNSAAVQALVIAHAAFGHNHFFKNNQLFKQWTDASAIIPYLDFAKNYIAKCEDKYGLREVERLLDSAHALMPQGIDRVKHARPWTLAHEEKRQRERQELAEYNFNDLWRTVPTSAKQSAHEMDREQRLRRLGLPEENILGFLEKFAPKLQPWQREVLRIVRNIAQYFYPQGQTKVMNEGCATYVHYKILERLHEKGKLTDGAWMEIIHSHSNVIFQPGYEYMPGFNPYALGFAMMRDIERITLEPTDEDREWFPQIAGNRDPWTTVRYVWETYRDESFVRQHLSPAVMRDFRMFTITDNAKKDVIVVDSIHNERGYRNIRKTLADLHDISLQQPEIQIVDVDLDGDRKLKLQSVSRDGVSLDSSSVEHVLAHLATLWGYKVMLEEINEDGTVKDTRYGSPLLSS